MIRWPKVSAPCSWCGKTFRMRNASQYGALRRGVSVYCSTRCRNAKYNNNRAQPHRLGPCPTCGLMFNSARPEKKYCSQDCYMSDPATFERLRRMSGDIQERHFGQRTARMTECPNCSKPIRKRGPKYCSKGCRREYFAARFDRWIASPESIALPQNFDEYMSGTTLPCLVEGCDWEGEHLGNHVNFAHGITADEFRELAGFNSSTGLVGIDLHRHLSERIKQWIEEGIVTAIPPPDPSFPGPPKPLTLEGREHLRKAQAIRRAEGSSQPPRPCRQCGEPAEQPAMGHRYYCSTRCRSRYYQEQGGGECVCAYCGDHFRGLMSQAKRRDRGLPVCCSTRCRNHMNIAKALAVRGIRYNAE